MPIPDWQLPPGVDRGLWDYLHAADMVAGYDEQMRVAARGWRTSRSANARSRHRGGWSIWAAAPGGCALTSRRRATTASAWICPKRCSRSARANTNVEWVNANLVDLSALPPASFDYAACLFSTLGMVRGRGEPHEGTRERLPIAEAGRQVRAARPQPVLSRAGVEASVGSAAEELPRARPRR